MEKWKKIRITTVILLIIFLLYLFVDAIYCMQMNYPHPMLGIDAHNWIEQFLVDLYFNLIIFGIPIIIDIILLIISIVKKSN